jgi:Asp-tRNA(Asn)/Glu-tRNA(Gln) amidotransferase A subunit family amidase
MPIRAQTIAKVRGYRDMTDASSRSAIDTGAGVLELLRLFVRHPDAAEPYIASQLKRAEAAESVLRAFEYLPKRLDRSSGSLSGIPVGIKDIIATKDMPTTNGSAVYRDHVPAADAWIVERLRQLGATIFGKTVSTEFAWRHPGLTTNPWNAKHTPGGSSSGSAAAVAAGIVPLALGTQTLGSIIRPAAFNGVVGFKPSFGAIPRTGVHPLSQSLDHVGFLARRVDDVALALSLLAGSSDNDPHGKGPLPGFQVDIDTGLKPVDRPRLAVIRFAKWSKAEPEQQKVFNTAVAKLRDAGAAVEELEWPELDDMNWLTINTILASEAAAIFRDIVERYPDRTSDRLKELVQTGMGHSAYDYLAAKALQTKLQSEFPARISGFDAVLTLSAFGEAPESLGYTGDAEYCAPWTLLGVPAISLPAGLGRNSLPLGIQVVGPYREDLRMLRVAKWIETTLNFAIRIPTVG